MAGSGHQPKQTGEAKPEPPTSGSAVKAASPDDLARVLQALDPVLTAIQRSILAKGVAYIDPKASARQDREDRAAIIKKLLSVFTEADIAEKPDSGQETPPFLSERDLVDGYRAAMLAQGLMLLPNASAFTLDGSGGVIVTVGFDIACEDGAYWPNVCTVLASGNDRVAQQRGGMGDKATARAMSAAWKEAVARLAFLARSNDPERFDRAHEALPTSRQSNTKPDKGPGMTIQQETEFKDRVLAGIGKAQNNNQLDRFIASEPVRSKLPGCSPKTKKEIEDKVDERRRWLMPRGGRDQDAQDRGSARRDSNRQARSGDYSDRGQDEEDRHGGNGGSRDEESRGGDLDDDIPF